MCLILCLIPFTVRADMIKTEGERKVVNRVLTIYNTLENSGQSVLREHNKIKDYISNNPGQIDQSNVTILLGLQTLLDNWQAKKQDTLDYITTNIPGINE